MEGGVATTAPQLVSVSFHLTQAELDALAQMAGERGAPLDLIIREALAEKKFFLEQRRGGNKVVLQDEDGKLSAVTWPNG